MIGKIVAEAEIYRKKLALVEPTNARALNDELYRLLHLRSRAATSGAQPVSSMIAAEKIFGYSERLEYGWLPKPPDRNGDAIFAKNGLHLRLARQRILEDGSFYLPAIRDRYMPGFAALLSPGEIPPSGTRIYLAARYERISVLGRIVSENIGHVADSYVVKALNTASEYPRSDAITIYLANTARKATLEMLDRLKVADYLLAPVANSAFARVEPSGVAWMESVAGSSGGYERASCVARALYRQMAEGTESTLEGAIRKEFEAAGINATHPNLYLD